MFARASAVAENLEMGAYAVSDKVAARAACNAARGVPGAGRARRASERQTLSGGQRRMLAIARALMSAPRLLFLDEVSLGLAPVAIDAIYVALRTIGDGDASRFCCVEQNVHRSLAVAGNVCVLDHGRVSFDRPPR